MTEEAEDVVHSFVANMHYITWSATQLSALLGDPTYTATREWVRGKCLAPLDVAQAVHDFKQFIVANPMPDASGPRRSTLDYIERAALCATLHKHMLTTQLTPSRLAYHCKHTAAAVSGWRNGWSCPPQDVLTVLSLWARYIQEHPFPQYRKGTHGGARHRHPARTVACSAKQSRMTPS